LKHLLHTFFLILFLSFFYGTAQNDSNKVKKLNDQADKLRRKKSDSSLILSKEAFSISDKIGFLPGKIRRVNKLKP